MEKKINAYVCPQLHATITVVNDVGATPMFIPCPICSDRASSRMFDVNQNIKPTHEWYSPNEEEMIQLENNKEFQLIQHVKDGGLLFREIKRVMPAFSRPIVFFDLESTGLDIVQDQIIQVGCVKIFPDGTKDSFVQLIKPSVPISTEAYEVHGISMHDLEDAPKFAEFAPELFSFIANCDLAGYNIIRFDIPLLMEEFLRVGINFSIENTKIIDVFTWYKKHRPQSNAAAYFEFFHEVDPNAHDALADAQKTEKVFNAMVRTIPEIGNTVEEWEKFNWDRTKMVDFAGKFIRNDIGEICFNFGPHKGQPVYNNIGMLNWMQNKNFTRDTMRWVDALEDNIQLSYSDENRKAVGLSDNDFPEEPFEL